jgi:hypothetical protein
MSVVEILSIREVLYVSCRNTVCQLEKYCMTIREIMYVN